jgi:hypothetical protein
LVGKSVTAIRRRLAAIAARVLNDLAQRQVARA